MRRPLVLVAALLAAAATTAVPVAASLPAAEAWEIGPVIRSRNYSHGMPLRPTPTRDGMRIAFPWPDEAAGHVHYVTFRHGPLAGKTRIVMRYRVDVQPGTRFVAREYPDQPATLSLFFQQRGDTWSAKGRYETYRWYAPDARTVPLTPGEHVVAIDLDDAWISVYRKTPEQAPAGFRAALERTDRIGFVLGSLSARGHGVYATGPATLTVTGFEVQ